MTYNPGNIGSPPIVAVVNPDGSLISAGGGGGGLSVVDQAAFTAGASNFTPVGGEYNSSAQTLTSGQSGMVALDANRNMQETLATLLAGEDLTNNVLGTLRKPVVGSQYAPGVYQNAGAVTKANIKSAAGNVFTIRITNANAAIRYFQLHNKATAPAAADTAQLYFLIPAGTATQPAVVELDTSYFAPSEYFATGIGWAISTTATTFTDSATAADHYTHVRYV